MRARSVPGAPPQAVRFNDDVEGKNTADQVADAGHEPDELIDAQPKACARDGDRVVEQPADPTHALESPGRQCADLGNSRGADV